MNPVVAISFDQLSQIPYLATSGLNSTRVLPSLAFFVSGQWHCWLVAKGVLHKVQMWPVESHYFGDTAERTTDQRFALLELLAQRTLFQSICRQFYGIWNDFQCLAASLAKMRLFCDAHKTGREVSRFGQTEIEYIVLVCRSVFDLLQEVVTAHWDCVHIDGKAPKCQLPKSFAKVVIYGDELLTAEQITKKYGLFPDIAQWYATQADFFRKLRALRTKIAHGGSVSVEMLFVTERGFAISRDLKPYCDYYSWPRECESPNRLVPIRPVLCSMVKCVLDACDSFAEVLLRCVKLPPELAPGLHFYSRGLHDPELNEIDSVLEHSLW